jgi:predicted SnoaL-like aldol condensation-catalyzing enzyme
MVRMKTTLLALALAGSLLAQVPVAVSDDPESLFKAKDKKLNANKQVVLHIVRDLLEAGQWSEAPKYLTERYIQHNPNFATGREPIMKAFGARPAGKIPGPKEWRTKVVSVVAEGDLVTVAIRRELDDPRNPGQKYTSTWFDMWRIMDGKADEHWDYGLVNPPNANAKGKQ